MDKINFYADTTKVGMPFIKIKEGDLEGSIFLLDTGSNNSLMFGYAYEQVKQRMHKIDCCTTHWGIEGKPMQVSSVGGKLTFDGQDYDMSFLLLEDDIAGKMLSEELGFTIAGIIGTAFMSEHDWVIDFSKQEVQVRNSNVSVE